MRKVLTIAGRDYRAAVFSKAFLISLVALPVLWGGSAAANWDLSPRPELCQQLFEDSYHWWSGCN